VGTGTSSWTALAVARRWLGLDHAQHLVEERRTAAGELGYGEAHAHRLGGGGVRLQEVREPAVQQLAVVARGGGLDRRGQPLDALRRQLAGRPVGREQVELRRELAPTRLQRLAGGEAEFVGQVGVGARVGERDVAQPLRRGRGDVGQAPVQGSPVGGGHRVGHDRAQHRGREPHGPLRSRDQARLRGAAQLVVGAQAPGPLELADGGAVQQGGVAQGLAYAGGLGQDALAQHPLEAGRQRGRASEEGRRGADRPGQRQRERRHAAGLDVDGVGDVGGQAVGAQQVDHVVGREGRHLHRVQVADVDVRVGVAGPDGRDHRDPSAQPASGVADDARGLAVEPLHVVEQ
jgi:hypothetical protein